MTISMRKKNSVNNMNNRNLSLLLIWTLGLSCASIRDGDSSPAGRQLAVFAVALSVFVWFGIRKSSRNCRWRSLTMRPRYKKKSAIGLGIGLPLLVIGLVLLLTRVNSGTSVAVASAMFLAGLPFYLWRCCALAQAKGYSRGIVLTAVFGVLFPVVVLLALPDKHNHYRGRS
jgi:hypothetical protein